jgi:hypothetical protein
MWVSQALTGARCVAEERPSGAARYSAHRCTTRWRGLAHVGARDPGVGEDSGVVLAIGDQGDRDAEVGRGAAAVHAVEVRPAALSCSR